ncbi:pentatricopeptide repeat-containing protein At1g51965, mitochondrial-like [Arachis ipaensis]|uniref:pentatricopeptide repeat-containing protein At1g51965, mitochondrial-like n=1 Tax=Arachis ipaensis TaxID=130454 RepID=UPI0007AF1432|nr:pentatricopeptide repeat-containing protein At1g51965, mitochondrial-like [Arachis ipaensis]
MKSTSSHYKFDRDDPITHLLDIHYVFLPLLIHDNTYSISILHISCISKFEYGRIQLSSLCADPFVSCSFGRSGEVDIAVKLFEELESSNCKPDVVTYNSLINCLGKNGDVDEAHMRFREMQEKGLNPDVVTYSTLIECFGKTDKVDMACKLFDEMLAVGCYPNLVTYNILLDCLERCGRTAEAVDLYAKLKQQGLTPDSITYAVLERLQSGGHNKLRFRRQNPITGWVVSPLR